MHRTFPRFHSLTSRFPFAGGKFTTSAKEKKVSPPKDSYVTIWIFLSARLILITNRTWRETNKSISGKCESLSVVQSSCGESLISEICVAPFTKSTRESFFRFCLKAERVRRRREHCVSRASTCFSRWLRKIHTNTVARAHREHFQFRMESVYKSSWKHHSVGIS